MIELLVFLVIKTILDKVANKYQKQARVLIKILEIIHWASLLLHPLLLF